MKFPRTPHLLLSPATAPDDKRLASDAHFYASPSPPTLVFTEKLDGSNVCLSAEALFSRSHSAPPRHSSFDAVKGIWANVKNRIQPDEFIFGEWLYAKHSIFYDQLPCYLHIFAIAQKGLFLSWKDTVTRTKELGLFPVPVLAMHSVRSQQEFYDLIPLLVRHHFPYSQECEGLVVRFADSFPVSEWGKYAAKWVRKDHIQTGDHWKDQPIVRNKLFP